MLYLGSRFRGGKPVASDGSRAGQLATAATARWKPQDTATATTVNGAVSQLNDVSGNSNNASWGTAANRPLLTRADNLENRVPDSDLAEWTNTFYWSSSRASLLANTITKGGKTLKELREDSTAANSHLFTNAPGSLGQKLNTISGQAYIVRFIAYSTNRRVQVRGFAGFDATYTIFNLITGVVASLGTNATNASMTSTGDGAYVCQVTLTANTTAYNSWLQWEMDDGTSRIYNGDGVSNIYFGDISFRHSSTNLYTLPTTSFPQLAGWQGNAGMVFDGSNDSLATSLAVNPTGGMWGGVVFRLSSSANSPHIFGNPNSGATRRLLCFMGAGTGALGVRVANGDLDYIFRSAPYGTFPDGITHVLTWTYNGGTSETGIKVFKNGLQVDTQTANLGAYTVPTAGGNFTIGRNGVDTINGTIYETIFGQGSQWPDADRQAWERSMLAQFVPQYAAFVPSIGITTDAGAVVSWQDTQNAVQARQDTAANRPIYTRSDNLENRVIDSDIATPATYWSGGARASFDGTTISKGGKTLRYLKEDGTVGNTHNGLQAIVGQILNTISGQSYKIRFIAFSTTRYISVRLLNGRSTGDYCTFNLADGTISELGTGFSNASTINNGDGSYVCEVTVEANATTLNAYLGFYLYFISPPLRAYNGDNVSGVYIGDISFRHSSTNLYTLPTTSFPQLAGLNGNSGLAFDGSNDSLATQLAVDPTGGMWGFAVVRTNSLAANNDIFIARPADATSRLIFRATITGQLLCRVANGEVDYIGRVAPAGSIVANTTYLVGFTYDGGTSSSGIKVYINGTQADTADGNGGAYTVPKGGAVLNVGGQTGQGFWNGTLYDTIFAQGSQWSASQMAVWVEQMKAKYNIA